MFVIANFKTPDGEFVADMQRACSKTSPEVKGGRGARYICTRPPKHDDDVHYAGVNPWQHYAEWNDDRETD
jgi:hypothetical protein